MGVLIYMIVGLFILNIMTVIVGWIFKLHRDDHDDYSSPTAFLNPIIEPLKYLYGFYILIFIVCGKNFVKSLRDWVFCLNH